MFTVITTRLYTAAVALAIFATPAAGRAAEPVAPSAPCASECFVLTGLTIDGVTAYPLADLAPLYDDYLAREIGMAELVRIAAAISDKYRADGYFLSRAVVPSAPDETGHAHIRVYEGYVSEVAVLGDRDSAAERLIKTVEGRRPLKLAELERALTLAGDIPGLKLKSELEPHLDDPANHRLVVNAELRRVSGSTFLDNRGTEGAGPWQSYSRLSLNSVAGSGDQLTLALLTTPQDTREFTQGEVSYAAALRNGSRLRVGVSGSKAQDVSDNFNAALGNESRAVDLRWTLPVIRSRKLSLWADASFDARQIEQRWATVAVIDRVGVARLAAHGQMNFKTGYSSGFVQVSRGVGALGLERAPGAVSSRWDADPRFWKVYGQAAYYRDLGSKTGVYLSMDGQWAPKPLLSSEEFSAGGQPYGRAYAYAEIMGEKGLAGQVEFRVGWDPKPKAITFFQGYAFADVAKVWNENAAPGWEGVSIASTGVGARVRFGDRLSLQVEAAKPISRIPYERSDKNWRPFVSLSSRF